MHWATEAEIRAWPDKLHISSGRVPGCHHGLSHRLLFPSQLNSAQCVFDICSVFSIHSSCFTPTLLTPLHFPPAISIPSCSLLRTRKQRNPSRTAHPAHLQPTYLSCCWPYSSIKHEKQNAQWQRCYFIRRIRNWYFNGPVQMKYTFLVILPWKKLVKTNSHITHPFQNVEH